MERHQIIYFSDSFSSFIWKDIKLLLFSLTLNVLKYPLIGNIRTNGVITLSKYLIKYSELFLFNLLWDNYINNINILNIYWFFAM